MLQNKKGRRTLNEKLFRKGTHRQKKQLVRVRWPMHGDGLPVFGGNGEPFFEQLRLRKTALSKEQKQEIKRRKKQN